MSPSDTKLQKVYELYKRGATEGERSAAETRLRALLKQRGISWEQFINQESTYTFTFKYRNTKDLQLLIRAVSLALGRVDWTWAKNRGKRNRVIQMTYQQWLKTNNLYAYFKEVLRDAEETAYLNVLREIDTGQLS